MSGGIAGIVCWASIFPLDILKTRVQTQEKDMEGEGAWDIAKQAYRRGGVGVFFDGIAVCLVRGFIVNAVEWAVYEEAMHVLK
ncbi:MAG: hypothetical protein MMC33_001815 [Icmadophila ericetorum]|nr:hypothetical protein [Icmadophila ericetorum]